MTTHSTAHDSFVDLVVVGGGPGGATLATLVARQGHRVLLLERERFPRYQIGESLLPATVHGICRLLGVWDEVQGAGFVRKGGATFRWGTSSEPWMFGFGQARLLEAAGANYAFQVERSKFDAILLDNARRSGVDVREGVAVQGVVCDGDRVTGVTYVDADGAVATVRARFVADASGNTSRIYKQVGERVFSQFFRNVALFCYFEGAGRLPAPNEGSILCEAFDKGWMWTIPLSLEPPYLTSVGAVIGADHVAMLQADPEKTMQECIAACPRTAGLLAGARRVTQGQYGQFRVRKDWSYTNERFWRPGMFLIGDSACFVDPVLSTGVHLATYAALLAARSVNSCLEHGLAEADSFREFEKRYRIEYETFYEFLITFYDMHSDQSSYFWNARKVLGTQEAANEAFVRLVAGGATAAELYFQDRAGAGQRLQALSAHLPMDALPAERIAATERVTKEFAPPARSADPRPVHVGSDDLRRLTWGTELATEAPEFRSTLRPSPDGCHWISGDVAP